jgi:hypothetical protein
MRSPCGDLIWHSISLLANSASELADNSARFTPESCLLPALAQLALTPIDPFRADLGRRAQKHDRHQSEHVVTVCPAPIHNPGILHARQLQSERVLPNSLPRKLSDKAAKLRLGYPTSPPKRGQALAQRSPRAVENAQRFIRISRYRLV